MSWRHIRQAWRDAMTDGAQDPWTSPPLQRLGVLRAFHAPGQDAATFVAVMVSVQTDGELLTLWVDGHPYLLRLDDLLRALAEADA